MGKEYPKVELRLFNALSGDGLWVAKWITDPEYLTFFRHNCVMPSLEECNNYPQWSQNMIMTVMDESGNTIGMVNGYHASYRNKTMCAGILLTKEAQKKGYGHSAFTTWVDYLIHRIGIRKVIAEVVDDNFIPSMMDCGFRIEGEHRKEWLMDGEWKDEVRLAVLDKEWRPSYVKQQDGGV